MDGRPSDVDLILTGRDAAPDVIERADIVSEVRDIKHPYHEGQEGEKGIEW